jgi:hypothetical protein
LANIQFCTTTNTVDHPGRINTKGIRKLYGIQEKKSREKTINVVVNETTRSSAPFQ